MEVSRFLLLMQRDEKGALQQPLKYSSIKKGYFPYCIGCPIRKLLKGTHEKEPYLSSKRPITLQLHKKDRNPLKSLNKKDRSPLTKN